MIIISAHNENRGIGDVSRKFVPRKNEVGNKKEGTTQRCNNRNDLSRLNGLSANDACPHCATKEQSIDGAADA